MPEHGQVHCDAENARLRAEVDRLNGLLVKSMFAEKRADEKRAAAEEARDVAEALLLQLSTTHRCTPGEMRKSCKRYLQGREPKIISVLKFKLWAMTEHRDAAQKRILELEAEVARLGGVVAALEEHLFRMSLDRAGHFWACDKCPNVMWGEHFVRQCPKCKSEGPFAPSTVHRWVTANPERADELRAKHHVILAIARDCLIPPAKEPANG
jgi:rubrerythrin